MPHSITKERSIGSTARKIWGWVQLALFAALLIPAWPLLRTELDTSRGFEVSNYSNSIWQEDSTEIWFTSSGSRLKYLHVTFVRSSEASAGSDLTVTLRDAASGAVLLERQLDGSEIGDGTLIRFGVPAGVKRGQQLVFALQCDAPIADAGFRILTGGKRYGDIDRWVYSGITDTELMPGLHIVYDHFGIKTLLAYLALAAVALAATWLPKSKFHPKACGWLSAGLFLAAPLAAWVLCQISGLNLGSLAPGRVLTNYLILLALQLVLLAAAANTGWAIGAGFTAVMIFSVINHFTVLFRGVALNWADIRVVSAAMTVMAQYNFRLDMPLLYIAAFTPAMISLAARYAVRVPLRPVLRHSLPLAAGAGLLVLSLSPLGQRLNGGEFSAFNPNYTARTMGQVYSFALGATKSRLEKPAGYSAAALQSAAAGYMIPDAGTGEMPDVIFIMNETLADLGSKVYLDTDTDPLSTLHALAADSDPRTFVGQTAVPSYGASTANTEFEAITGFSMRNLESGAYPFVQYISEGTPSLCMYLQALGYTGSYLHPGYPADYNRSTVYAELGFDTVKFLEDFSHRDTLRSWTSDRACYEEILQLLDEGDGPQFIFNVTIQNHGGWHGWGDKLEQTVNFNAFDEELDTPSTLLTLYRHSDAAFAWLLQELEKRERPTLVVMFGDHLPAFSDEELALLGLDEAYEADPLSKYTTPLVMWANYDADLSAVPGCISTNYLPAVLAKAAGLPLSGQQQFMLEMMQTLPVYSPAGCYDAAGQPAEPGEAGSLYQQMQYAFLRDAGALPEGFALPVTED